MIPHNANFQAILTALGRGGEHLAEVVIAQGPDRLKVEKIIETCESDPAVQAIIAALRGLHLGAEVYTTMRYPLIPRAA